MLQILSAATAASVGLTLAAAVIVGLVAYLVTIRLIRISDARDDARSLAGKGVGRASADREHPR